MTFTWEDLKVGKILKVFTPIVVLPEALTFTSLCSIIALHGEEYYVYAINTEWLVLKGNDKTLKIDRDSLSHFRLKETVYAEYCK